jgi:hypothetical protein
MAGVVANVLVGHATIKIATVDVGYTIDGATLAIRSSFAEIKVEEVVGTIIRRLTDQEVTVSFNMAEASLVNLKQAVPGSILAAAVLTVGGSPLQDVALELKGKNPAGFDRTVALPHCNPIGEVSMPFRKNEVSVVQVTFSVLASAAGVFGTITDSAA